MFDPAGSRPLTVVLRIGDGFKAQYESGSGVGAMRENDNVTALAPNVPPPPPMPLPYGGPPFRVDLIPRSRQPLSFVDSSRVDLDAKGQVVLSDVSPGTYRLRVIDGLNGGALFEREITVPTDALPMRVSLGAGSIKGRFLGAGDIAGGEVIAVAPGGQGERPDALGAMTTETIACLPGPRDLHTLRPRPQGGLVPRREHHGGVERDGCR